MDPRAGLNYVTGFSKLNNPERFELDIWEGEKQFDRIYRPSAAATRKRIEYLYPNNASTVALDRYLTKFAELIDLARGKEISLVVLKLPVPQLFRELQPGEALFDAELSRLLAERGVRYADFTRALDESRFYFDTDHLNRAGTSEFLARHLKSLLVNLQSP